jgi:hypothetical protein
MSLKIISGVCLMTLVLLLMQPAASMENAGDGESHIAKYAESIRINQDGTADITTKIILGTCAKEFLYLPYNWTSVEKLQAKIGEGGESMPAEVRRSEGIDYICVTVGGKKTGDEPIVVTFRDPAYLSWKEAGPGSSGIYRHKSAFRNTTTLFIDEYAMEVILPPGFLIHSYGKSVPEYSQKDPMPPYSSKNLPDGSHIYIDAKKLSVGSRCMLEYAFVRKAFSSFLFGACIIAMALFMVFFRDMLREGKDGASGK